MCVVFFEERLDICTLHHAHHQIELNELICMKYYIFDLNVYFSHTYYNLHGKLRIRTLDLTNIAIKFLFSASNQLCSNITSI